MKKYMLLTLALAITAVGLLFMLNPPAQAAESNPPQVEPVVLNQEGEQEGCLSCHAGIENIRDEESIMFKSIKTKGECTACHGGDPAVTGEVDDEEAATAAHTGAPEELPFDEFYPDPGSVWIADKTCGQTGCHENYAHALERSLMNTEAGKIQGNLWAWGAQHERKVKYGNYDVSDSETIFGTDVYKAYMAKLKEAYPDQFPDSLEMLPNPTVEEIAADPKLAAFTYQRQQCQRCHVGNKGRARRGDWRGMGCSSCHIPYGNEGLYEGGDPTIPKDEAGHLLVHEIQGTREARNGIPTETCNSCHNRGKRIGVSYQGIMEFPYGTPYDEGGSKQPGLHTKQYLFIKADLHHEKQSRPENPEGGMLCQDCHTSLEMHGDGNIYGTTLGQVEIECSDCHGTTSAFPWELPVGYGEEFAALGELASEGRGLGTTDDLMTPNGTVYEPKEGYLLTTRGNPLGNVVKDGDKVILHSATGRDYFVPVLKQIATDNTWVSPDAEVAMGKIAGHMDKMECYACHADWAPQCYGCHVQVNYGVDENGEPLTDTDWVASGNAKFSNGTHDSVKSPGKVSESRSYLRWEEPVLGINGEGRVTPLMPGCQVVFTVKGPDGETIVSNEIGRTAPNEEGGGPEGQRGMDMAPVQPHTSGRQARRCESCHNNPKALGYGIEGGRFQASYSEDIIIDLWDKDGNPIPKNYQVQIPAIPDLEMDWSQIVDPETGEQLQTVGSHWPDSRPLDEDQRVRMERTGLCMGCHQNMADSAFWNDKVIAKFGQAMTDQEHIDVMNQLIQAAVDSPGGAASMPSGEAVTSSALDIFAWIVAGLVLGVVVGGGIVLVAKRK